MKKSGGLCLIRVASPLGGVFLAKWVALWRKIVQVLWTWDFRHFRVHQDVREQM